MNNLFGVPNGLRFPSVAQRYGSSVDSKIFAEQFQEFLLSVAWYVSFKGRVFPQLGN